MIKISDLSKDYPKTRALNHVSFVIHKGIINGLVGPNGSGKTTLIHCLLRHLEFDGDIAWGLEEPRLFFIPDENILPDLLSGKEYLLFIEHLYKRKDNALKQELLELFEMDEAQNKSISSYSYGMKKKIQLIASFIVNADILILDEIFRGLDMKAISDTKQLLLRYTQKGGTVLLSSHDILAVEQMCASIVLLVKGNLKAYGSPQDLLESHNKPSLEALFIDLMQ